MKLIYLLIILIFVGCKREINDCCHPDDLVIADLYHVENNKESRFVCVSGILGEKIESKYLSTEQLHTYNLENTTIQLHFFHDLVIENYTEESLDRNLIDSKTFDLSFGKLVMSTYSEHAKEGFINNQTSIMDYIKIEEHFNSKICFSGKEKENPLPKNLKDLGAFELLSTVKRQELKIRTENPEEEALIEILYPNIELLKRVLNDGDIITFYTTFEEESIIRSYIIVDSKIENPEEDGFCGMGSKQFRFECVYLNKNHGL